MCSDSLPRTMCWFMYSVLRASLDDEKRSVFRELALPIVVIQVTEAPVGQQMTREKLDDSISFIQKEVAVLKCSIGIE